MRVRDSSRFDIQSALIDTKIFGRATKKTRTSSGVCETVNSEYRDSVDTPVECVTFGINYFININVATF